MRIGIIGLGAIGGAVVQAWREGALGSGLEVVSVLVRTPRPAGPPPVTTERAAFLQARPEVVLEVAGQAALAEHGETCLRAGADLVVTSAGALTDDGLRTSLVNAARDAGRRVVVASAGIGALDILAGAAVGGLLRVRVTVRKDPTAWYGTPAADVVNLAGLVGPVTLYEGPVREGARLYPQNVNISAAAALAGIGLDLTELAIVADPTVRRHVIEIEAEGTFGGFRFREEIEPTSENPKTGKLVAMAVIKTLRQLASPLVIGG